MHYSRHRRQPRKGRRLCYEHTHLPSRFDRCKPCIHRASDRTQLSHERLHLLPVQIERVRMAKDVSKREIRARAIDEPCFHDRLAPMISAGGLIQRPRVRHRTIIDFAVDRDADALDRVLDPVVKRVQHRRERRDVKG